MRPSAPVALQALLLLAVTCGATVHFAHAQSPDRSRQLEERRARFPEADTNRDGVLTEDEARAHQAARKPARPSRTSSAAATARPPTFADARYGPHERNVLDFWRATGDGPTPVLVFFHGGSFKAGDKAIVTGRPIFEECLAAGISVVSANYRYTTTAPFPAPMHDGARAVQYVRAMAREWRLDPARVAVSGSSAGATLALWVALHDDRADPASTDPIARQSTRVTCASPHSGTAGLEPEYITRQTGAAKFGAALYQLFGASGSEGLETAAGRALTREASPLRHATPDDPPLFLTYAGRPEEAPFPPGSSQRDWIHHVALGQPLKARYDELGLPCTLHHQGQPAPTGAEIAFLKKFLQPAAR